jgi:RHS repeat-associated protein
VGNITTVKDSLGTRTSQYDAINRLLSISSATDTLTYVYDKANNMVKAESPDSTMTSTYDAANRLTRIDTFSFISGATQATGYSYDANDNRTQISYPSGLTVQYQYNSLNQVQSITGFGGSVTGVGYYTAAPKIGLLKQYTYSNGLANTLDYTTRRAPLNTTASVLKQTFGYDNRGNLKTLGDVLQPSRNKSFTYDQLNRMTGFNGPWGNWKFSYSAGGNRASRTSNADPPVVYSYSANLLRSVGNQVFYTYNNDGDLAAITHQHVPGRPDEEADSTLEYNPFHQLKTYTKVGLGTTEFGYDAHGGRAYKKSADITTSYYEDHGNGNILSEIPNMGDKTDYVYLGNLLVARLQTPAYDGFPISFYHSDPYGTPHVLTGSDGSVIWQMDYWPFGQGYRLATEETFNKKLFLGKEKDRETGLGYFGARYYDETIGRFISADPVGLVDARTGKVNAEILVDPQRLNRYAYGLNNPYRYVDPDGKFAFLLAAAPYVPAAVAAIGEAAAYSAAFLAGAYGGQKIWDHVYAADNTKEKGKNQGDVIHVDPQGNAIPIKPEQTIEGRSDGKVWQVKDANGNPTGDRYDGLGHPKQADPKAQEPHGHRVGPDGKPRLDGTGNPHLPANPPRKKIE